MRAIKYIVIHCSSTKEGKEFNIDDIRKWHVQVNGWRDVGYHYVIGLHGECWSGRKEDEIGAHVVGYNRNSIGVCYIGGIDENGKPKDTRTQKQKHTMYFLLKELKSRYPNAIILGHHDLFNGKACPCFDAKKEYSHITIT